MGYKADISSVSGPTGTVPAKPADVPSVTVDGSYTNDSVTLSDGSILKRFDPALKMIRSFTYM